MKRTLLMKTTLIALVVILVVGSAWATPPSKGKPLFYWRLVPVDTFAQAGQLELELKIEMEPSKSDSVLTSKVFHLHVFTSGGLEYFGPTEFTVDQVDLLHTPVRMKVIVPDNDTSSLWVRREYSIHGKSDLATIARPHFVTTGDSVEYWPNVPYLRPDQWEDRRRQATDTTRYRVKMDLRDEEQHRIVSFVADTSGYPIEPTDEPGYYIVWLTAHYIKYLKSDGFRYEVIDVPPPIPEDPTKTKGDMKKLGPPPSQRPRPKPTGKLDTDCGVYVTCVDGEDEWGRIYANQLVTFYLSYWNGTGESIYGVDNGFKIYADAANRRQQHPRDLVQSL